MSFYGVRAGSVLRRIPVTGNFCVDSISLRTYSCGSIHRTHDSDGGLSAAAFPERVGLVSPLWVGVLWRDLLGLMACSGWAG